MAIFGWSCGASGQSTYSKDMVQDAVMQDDVLSVSVPLETAFFMAGAKLIDETDETVVLKLVRCKLKKKCAVDYTAQYNRDTGFHEMRISQKAVTISFDDKTSLSVAKSK